ncbi:uncharacterized protein LOC123559670 [Mercenaria mercenaria]|uniref:uncharacterized protein LOC123559670 n=1 Tax=Mercenaria mercenaria TaxID=6596 RepID=UPI00234E80EE|nr:uncharacterized protein LOC123559670 [Mercenaria mercenaria]
MASAMNEKNILYEIEKILHERDNWACRKSFNLLYSARNSGNCDPKEFHKNCDYKPETVTILFGENGVIFGGYAKKEWSIIGNFIKDEAAFLFRKSPDEGATLEMLNIMKNQENWALYCHENYGPCFGGGRFTSSDLMAFKRPWYGLCILENGIFNLNGTSTIKSGVYCPTKDGTDLIGRGPMKVTDVRVYQVEVEKNPVWRRIPTKEAEMEELKMKIDGIKPKDELGVSHLNILLIGSSRAGKSSLCNTLSVVLTRKLDRVAETGSENSSVTNKLHCYKLVCKTNDQLKIHITDIRGYEEHRGYDYELEKILDGELKPGYHFDDTEKEVSKSDLAYAAKTDNAIHAVCFVADVTQKHNQQLRQQFQKIKKVIRKRDLPIIGIATKLDTQNHDFEQNFEHMYRDTKCEYKVKGVALSLEIQANAVFPVVNYTDDEYFHEKKDFLALIALDFIIQKIMIHIKELKEWKALHDHKDIWFTRNEEVLKLTQPKFKNEVMQIIEKEDNLEYCVLENQTPENLPSLILFCQLFLAGFQIMQLEGLLV